MQEEVEYKYPCSEFFVSQQGEGVYSGQMQQFVRLAGCTVGKPLSRFSKEEQQKLLDSYPVFAGTQLNYSLGLEMPKPLPVYTEVCSIIGGRKMFCDTDYRVKERLTAKEIAGRIDRGVKAVCITGGEPMMHPLLPLVDEFHRLDKEVHLETSGTIPLEKVFPTFTTRAAVWITCSPKLGALPDVVRSSNEIKLLVDEDFDSKDLLPEILAHDIIYCQPINNENSISIPHLQLCLEWQKKYPKWRLSLQLHKVLEHLLGEHIR